MLLFVFFQSIDAQTGSIRGRIFDKQAGEPVFGANVWLQGTSLGSASDFDGKYFIRSVPEGKYNLTISYIGYNTVTLDVNVQAGKTLELDVTLEAKTLSGETVVITAQAEGQLSAINQQLTSNTIANIVSKARIEELPDVNAAESIGRLPGVSIQRYGGEATKVAIRGLSPKYNAITVNGVRLPATGGDDRSVDLSLISSSMLDGITLKKANTPDMDADALGGTVDLKLKEAPEKMALNFSLQGGYNKLQNHYGNYNFMGSFSNRFFDGDLGVIASINVDDYDRSADKFSGNWRQSTNVTTKETEILVSGINLREEKVDRARTGASAYIDYRIPFGKVTLNSFFNRLKSDYLIRVNQGDLVANRHYYFLEDGGGTTSMFTGSFGLEQDYNWIKFDIGVSRTASRNNSPNNRQWQFKQENASYKAVSITPETPPTFIPTIETIDTLSTGLAEIYVYKTKLTENESTLQLNVQLPFRLDDQINGHIKTGGKLRWLNRYYDQEQDGRNGLEYGSSGGVNAQLASMLKWLSQNNPDEWNWKDDSLLVRKAGVFPVSRVLSNYTRDNFLNNEYPLGFALDQEKMNQLMDALFATGQNRNYSIGSLGNDYDGIERYQAAYLMAEINFTKYLTVIPGFRWEKDKSVYHGQRFREVTLNNVQGPPADLTYLETERNNEYFLPMFHIISNPLEWMKIRLARTETLTRPDFVQYAPITRINSYQNYIRAANSTLKPSKSINLDAAISLFENHIGLFTISGFQKKIQDLIFQSSYIQQSGIPVFEGLNIPENWLKNAAPQVDAYYNNPGTATYKGFELDWQTSFWYLPEPLNGVVFNINYTNIKSEIEKRLFYNKQGNIIPGSRPPRRENLLIDSSRTARMPDQPTHILNLTLGYDYKDFSARVSYLYQTDRTTYIDREPILDQFSGTYARWDLTFQQKLDYGIQIFANLNNLNARPDKNFRGSALTNPTYIEYYGFTMDLGVRVKL